MIVATLAADKFEIVMSILPVGLRPKIAETAVSVLTISRLSQIDTGNYSCRASNAVNSVFLPTPYSLTIRVPPPPNFCSLDPCLNGGLCVSGSTSFKCECQNFFTGIICDIGMYVLLILLQLCTNFIVLQLQLVPVNLYLRRSPIVCLYHSLTGPI